MIPDAILCHVCPGRARLRIESMRGDEAWFHALEQALSEHFDEVLARSSTGSIVLRDARISRGYLHAVAANQELFRLEETQRDASQRPGFAVDPRATYASLGVVFVVLAVIQAYRGRLLAPTATLLWYAIEAMRFGQGKG